jgi:hypothetical protein
MHTIDQNQARAILTVLDLAGRGVLIERTPDGWWVESEMRAFTEESYACEGATLADALAQLTQSLALDLGIDPEMLDADERIPYAPEPVVEFCQPIAQVDARGRFTEEYSAAWMATHEPLASIVVNE